MDVSEARANYMDELRRFIDGIGPSHPIQQLAVLYDARLRYVRMLAAVSEVT